MSKQDTETLGLVRNEAGERLDYTFTRPGGVATGQATLMVIGHGVTANKDRAWAVNLAGALAVAGFPSVRFSFAGNGDSEGRFEDATVTKELSDLGAILDAVNQHLPGMRCGYAGHSQGGAVGVLRAAMDDRIRALVSLAGMVHVAEFAQRKFGDQEAGQSLMWDKPECPLSTQYMADMQCLGSTVEAAAQVTVPWLLVHGIADTVVLPQDTEDAAAAARTEGNTAVAVEWLADHDHVFSADEGAAMAQSVVSWLSATDTDSNPS